MPDDDDALDDDKIDDKDKPDPVEDDKSDKSAKDADTNNDLGDAGKKAIDAMKRERNAAKKELAEIRDKLKSYEDQGKTESQRLQEAAEEARTRAAGAESNFRKMQIALDKAPDGASLAHIRAVAKRMTGDTPEDMEADADELFTLLAPGGKNTSASDEGDGKPPKSLPAKPREKLRGGGDPEDEPEEMDPRKLAELIRRH